ncbi:MAG: RNase III inhibitor, partial [Hymenobacter sp.]
LGGGGVDGAIHRAGGPQILAECQQIRARQGGCKVGQAVITSGGRLPAKHVIHTVGPRWNGGHKGEPELLASCYRTSLLIASDNKLESVAFPGISTGIYHYPKPAAAAIAVREVQQWLAAHEWPREVVFVVFEEENHKLYEQAIAGA